MEGQEGHEWQEGHEGHEGQEGQEGHVHKLEFLIYVECGLRAICLFSDNCHLDICHPQKFI